MAFLLIAGPLRRFWKGDPEFCRSNQICRSYVDTFVDEVLAYKKREAPVGTVVEEGGIRRNSFLKDLASATNDKGKIRGELLSLLLAGRDTTASLLSSLFYHISRRPDVWDKLREEVDVLGGSRPTYAELRNLTYAKYCINEGKCPMSLGSNCTAELMFSSIAALPTSTDQRKGRRPRHSTSSRWRSEWEITNIYPKRPQGSLFHILNAPTQRYLGRRRRRVPA